MNKLLKLGLLFQISVLVYIKIKFVLFKLLNKVRLAFSHAFTCQTLTLWFRKHEKFVVFHGQMVRAQKRRCERKT